MKGKVEWKIPEWDHPAEAKFYSEKELEIIINHLVNDMEVKIILDGGET